MRSCSWNRFHEHERINLKLDFWNRRVFSRVVGRPPATQRLKDEVGLQPSRERGA